MDQKTLVSTARLAARKLWTIIGMVMAVMGVVTGTDWLGWIGVAIMLGAWGWELYKAHQAKQVLGLLSLPPELDSNIQIALQAIGGVLVVFGVVDDEQWRAILGGILMFAEAAIALVRSFIRPSVA